MAEDFHILRLGYYEHAPLLPLLHPLNMGWAALESPWKFELLKHEPQELVNNLMSGDLDAAFVSSVSAWQHGDRLMALGGWGLASEGALGTAILLAPQRLDLMNEGHVALSPQAHGSTASYLLRTLLKPYYDITLHLHPPDDPAHDPRGARLLYGDSASREVQNKPKEWVAEDLGVAWFVLSGLPMVWEMLVVPRDLEKRKPGAGDALQAALRLSQRAAQEQQSTILAEASSRLGIEQPQVKELFSRLRHTLGQQEQKGLAFFLDQASRAHVLPR